MTFRWQIAIRFANDDYIEGVCFFLRILLKQIIQLQKISFNLKQTEIVKMEIDK